MFLIDNSLHQEGDSPVAVAPAAHKARAAASEAEVFTISPELKRQHRFCEVVVIECKPGRL
jgi:hypothetical protein